MLIGFGVPQSGAWATRENLLHVARRAEQLGYHSLWTYQRLLGAADHSWGAPYRAVHDPVATLGLLAGVTDRVRLGVSVLNLPFYNPTVLGKQLATLDLLSAGRLDVGLGLGWADEEYVAAGAEKRHRGRRSDEFVAVLKALWTEELVEHEGEFYRVPRSRMEPKPVQRPHPPILLGGSAPALLRRVGRIADGWMSSSRVDPATIGATIDTIKAAAAEAGRDPAALRFICRVPAEVRPAGASTEPRAPWTGTLDEIRADLAMIARQGITEAFIDLNFDPEIGSPDADRDEAIRRAAETLDALAP